MSYKVWRRMSDNSVVGYCDATYLGFEPGGNLASYTVTTETGPPVMPEPPPTSARKKLLAALADPTVPATVKDVLRELIP